MNSTFLKAVSFLQNFLKNPNPCVGIDNDAVDYSQRIIELEGPTYGITMSLLHRFNAENKTILFGNVKFGDFFLCPEDETLFNEYNDITGRSTVVLARKL